MDITIDKGVPIPKARSPRHTYPLHDMKRGDSFFVPGKRPCDLSGALKNIRDQHEGWQFTSRSVTEDGVEGVRVWRIK